MRRLPWFKWALNAMTTVLIRKRQRDHSHSHPRAPPAPQTHKIDVKTEAEVGIMQPETKEHLGNETLGRFLSFSVQDVFS